MRWFICSLLVLLPTCRLAADGHRYVEAGVSYLRLSKPDIPMGSSFTLTAVHRDRSAWAPFIATGWSFSEALGLRASYRYIDGVDAGADYSIVDSTGSYYLRNRYSDELHVVSVAPELTLRVMPNVTFGFAPELNWVHARQSTRTDSNAPMILVLPYHTDSESAFSLGASAAAQWTWSPGWAASLRYSWIDLDPSWNRRAHVLSGAVAWRW